MEHTSFIGRPLNLLTNLKPKVNDESDEIEIDCH
jgi:hypothetical protein